jgi:pilus assembly protein CpaB
VEVVTKNRRLGLALFVALVVSLVVTIFLYKRIKHQYAMTTQPIKIIVASKQLDPGTALAMGDVTMADWPANMPLSGGVTRAEDVLGRIVLYPIAPQEPVRNQLLAVAGTGMGLTAKIPDGMRAVAIETNEVNNVSGFLFPGCRVDVLVTLRPDSTTNKEPLTATVLQNIQVLSTGEKLQPDPAGKPQNVKQVSLLLTPEDAEKLVLAANQGTVQFVLRNGSDQAQELRPTVGLRDLHGGGKPVAAPVRRVAAPSVASAYEVETYDGTKKGVVKF